jgi:hypothetical protein
MNCIRILTNVLLILAKIYIWWLSVDLPSDEHGISPAHARLYLESLYSLRIYDDYTSCLVPYIGWVSKPFNLMSECQRKIFNRRKSVGVPN